MQAAAAAKAAADLALFLPSLAFCCTFCLFFAISRCIIVVAGLLVALVALLAVIVLLRLARLR